MILCKASFIKLQSLRSFYILSMDTMVTTPVWLSWGQPCRLYKLVPGTLLGNTLS